MSKAQSNPTSYEAQFNYALEAHKLKDYNNALLYYKKAQNLDPSKEETYLNLAQIYIERNGTSDHIHIGNGCNERLIACIFINRVVAFHNDIL